MIHKIALIFITLLTILVFAPCAGQYSKEQWFGDVSDFEFSSMSIQLNAPAISDQKYISTEQSLINNAEWRLSVRLDFNPSSSNYVKIFIVSDKKELNNTLKGYFVMIGNTTDEVSLYRQDGLQAVKIIDGMDKRLVDNSSIVRLKINRDSLGAWILSTQINDETTYKTEGTAFDATYKRTSFFGFHCVYTATRSDKMSFSDLSISGDPYVDKEPPTIELCMAITENRLGVWFNEQIVSPIQNLSFTPPDITYSSITIDSNYCEILINSSFEENRSYNIEFDEIYDVSGNVSNKLQSSFFYVPFKVAHVELIEPNQLLVKFSRELDITTFSPNNITLNSESSESHSIINSRTILLNFKTHFKADLPIPCNIESLFDVYSAPIQAFSRNLFIHHPKATDIIFTEVMADPNPPVALPEEEYIELFNRSEYDLNLEGWGLHIGNKTLILPNYLLKSNSYLLLCNDATLFNDGIPVLSVSLPSITNSEVELLLTDRSGQCIDWLKTDISQHNEPYKASGGWSLERIDVSNLSHVNNWTSSISPAGGTPGTMNSSASANPDSNGPHVESIEFVSSSLIRIGFNERIISDASSLLNPHIDHNYHIDKLHPNTIDIRFTDALDSSQIIHLNQMFIKDMNGNSGFKNTIALALPITPKPGNIIINEIMPKPHESDPEFIEFYNRTNRFIDLSNIVVSKRNSKTGFLETGWSLTPKPMIMAPQSFLLLTSFLPDSVIHFHQIFETNKLSLPNDSASIVLMLSNGTIIDELDYYSFMHSNYLSDPTGVSLERIDPAAETNKPFNWTSAASTWDYSSPGKHNSQQLTIPDKNEDWLTFSSSYLSPNGDSDHDQLFIRMTSPESEGQISIAIYNLRGNKVKTIANNALSGSTNTFVWDGTNAQMQQVSVGVYVIISHFYNTDGMHKQMKKAIAVYGN